MNKEKCEDPREAKQTGKEALRNIREDFTPNLPTNRDRLLRGLKKFAFKSETKSIK